MKKHKYFEIPSRAKAISKAINDLQSGDVLIVAGKGHENYQEYRTRKVFSDKSKILLAINKKNKFLSNSLKTNVFNENFTNNNLKKNIFVNSASINSKKISTVKNFKKVVSYRRKLWRISILRDDKVLTTEIPDN